ncbi:GNAT family N-acetyltransferase [Nocardiopsis alba]|uniref:GNAT family N-acetyltransferase n=1 Tax=Nocardiopsis alba TaxID=53437 RepID=UPI0036CFE00B
MGIEIRDHITEDREAVVALSLRAWEPVHASIARVLGPKIYARVVGDWSRAQSRDVRAALDSEEMRTRVAVTDRIAGFSTVRLDRKEGIGVLHMLAVDPEWQGRGVGRELVAEAERFMREEDMKVALVETGGDPGHAPARAVYEGAGYTGMPVVHYYKALRAGRGHEEGRSPR